MSNDTPGLRAARYGPAALFVAALFLWAASPLAPQPLDLAPVIDTLEAGNGPHPGFRRNHAKGVCLSGWFDSNGAGARLSKASVFQPGWRMAVSGRFALAGGLPAMRDGPNSVRSMALSFTLPNDETWRTGMNAVPVFPVRDARGFHENVIAIRPDPATGKPDPEKIEALLAARPETARALVLIKAHVFSSGFANETYNSLNAFRLIDGAGTATAVRWSMVPVDAFEPHPAERPAGRHYLFDALAERIARGPVQWRLVLTVGQPGDPTDNATLPWPPGREQVDAGTLTVTALQSEAEGNCRDTNFDPLMLPAGIAPSDDPLLQARSDAYAVSFTRRSAEKKTPSAVQVGK
jgi:catalase